MTRLARQLRRRLTYANVISTLALFIALGGVGYAAVKLPANSVGTKQLRNKAVTLKKLSPQAIAALQGQAGARGERGDKGEKGDGGTLASLWQSYQTNLIGEGNSSTLEAVGTEPVGPSGPIHAGSYFVVSQLTASNNDPTARNMFCSLHSATYYVDERLVTTPASTNRAHATLAGPLVVSDGDTITLECTPDAGAYPLGITTWAYTNLIPLASVDGEAN